MYLKTPNSGRRRMVETVSISIILGYKDILGQAGLEVLHILLLDGARLKHGLRMVTSWKPE